MNTKWTIINETNVSMNIIVELAQAVIASKRNKGVFNHEGVTISVYVSDTKTGKSIKAIECDEKN